jgi:hypothetical protein
MEECKSLAFNLVNNNIKVLECLIAVYRAELVAIHSIVEVPDFLKGDTMEIQPQKKEESKYLLNPLGYFLDYSSWFGTTPESTH